MQLFLVIHWNEKLQALLGSVTENWNYVFPDQCSLYKFQHHHMLTRYNNLHLEICPREIYAHTSKQIFVCKNTNYSFSFYC